MSKYLYKVIYNFTENKNYIERVKVSDNTEYEKLKNGSEIKEWVKDNYILSLLLNLKSKENIDKKKENIELDLYYNYNTYYYDDDLNDLKLFKYSRLLCNYNGNLNMTIQCILKSEKLFFYSFLDVDENSLNKEKIKKNLKKTGKILIARIVNSSGYMILSETVNLNNVKDYKILNHDENKEIIVVLIKYLSYKSNKKIVFDFKNYENFKNIIYYYLYDFIEFDDMCDYINNNTICDRNRLILYDKMLSDEEIIRKQHKLAEEVGGEEKNESYDLENYVHFLENVNEHNGIYTI